MLARHRHRTFTGHAALCQVRASDPWRGRAAWSTSCPLADAGGPRPCNLRDDEHWDVDACAPHDPDILGLSIQLHLSGERSLYGQ